MPSGLWQIAYDKDRKELEITFGPGQTYTFEGVPEDVARRFGEAENKGEFYNTFIRGAY